MKKIDWIIGALVYSFIAALIPGAIWLFVGLFVDGAVWFMKLSWGIKIPAYIITGVIIQIIWPLHRGSKN